MPNLRIRDAGREFTFQIEGDAATIGRGDTNDIDLEDAKASKEHCRIERAGQRWKLVDLESKNGTRVNSEFRNKAWLTHGDTIQIGAAEIRFGLEGASRVARTAAAREAEEAAEEGAEEPASRRYRKKSNLPVVLSLSSLAVVLFFLVSMWAGSRTALDRHNMQVLDEADKLVKAGRYDDALLYMSRNADTDGNAYPEVEKRMAEIRERKDAYVRNTLEEEARKIVSRAGRLIRAYNAGSREVGPEEILALFEQLKTKYAATEQSDEARRTWPAWFAGRVPERASDLLAGGGRLRKDWEEALARADQFRKEMYFREARETIARFVTEREAILGGEDLRQYQELRDQELEKIDRLADSIYRARVSAAERLLVNKRYDEAIAVYREVIEKFGLDAYVRRAQAEIGKIEELKRGGK